VYQIEMLPRPFHRGSRKRNNPSCCEPTNTSSLSRLTMPAQLPRSASWSMRAQLAPSSRERYKPPVRSDTSQYEGVASQSSIRPTGIPPFAGAQLAPLSTERYKPAVVPSTSFAETPEATPSIHSVCNEGTGRSRHSAVSPPSAENPSFPSWTTAIRSPSRAAQATETLLVAGNAWKRVQFPDSPHRHTPRRL